MKLLLILIATMLALLNVEAPAQVLWKPTTTSTWLNPVTQEEDSAVCVTALSCYGNNCTAAGRIQMRDSPWVRLIVYRSNDGGRSWHEQSLNLQYKPRVTDWAIKEVQQIDSLHAIIASREFGFVARTTNGGATWHSINYPVERELLDIHFSDPLTGVLTCVGSDSNIYTTSDGGVTWVNRPWTDRPWPSMWSCHSYGNGSYYFFKYGHGPFYTTEDDFVTFDSTSPILDSVSDPNYDYIFGSIEYGSKDTMYAMGNYYESIDGQARPHGLIRRTTDNGKTWEDPWIFPWENIAFIRHISSIQRDSIFAGGGDNRHYVYSHDRGKTWTVDSILIDTNHETARCFGMEISADGHPIAAFGSPGFAHESIIARGEQRTSKVEYTEFIKYYTNFYPNPTTGSVNIETIIKMGMPVTVMDIMGRELLKTKLSEEGKLTVDISHLPPGIYNIVFNFLGKVFIVGKVAKIE